MPSAVIQDETALAHAAAAGDGQAFATLYERYEGRAFNLALRITDSRDDAADATQDAFVKVMRRLPEMGDRELNFGSYLFTATRNACYDLIAKRRRADPTDEIPETAAPMAGGGGFGFDPGDPEDDPERGQLLDAQQEEIRAANARLPERHREVLALYELEDMSYDEIAEIMDMNRNSVAQLISRARINLRDELRGTAMGAIAASTAECEQALPLIAMQDDGQVDTDAEKREWLAAHVAACDTCRLSREAMQEAGASYRCWLPVAAAPLLMKETMARAAELTGSDWGDTIAERVAARGGAGSAGGAAGGSGVASALGRHRRRDAVLASILAAVVLVVGFEVALEDGEPPTTADPAAADVEPAATKVVKKKTTHKKKVKKDGTVAGPTDSDRPIASGEASAGTGAGGHAEPSGPDDAVTKAPVKKRVIKQPPPELDPDPPTVDEPPVVEEPPGRTDDPQPCRPAGTRATC